MATRIKTPAHPVAVPQSKEACAADVALLGDLQRMFGRQRAEMNDLISAVTLQHQPVLQDLSERIAAIQQGVQTWCESHRVELCGERDRLGKTANLVTGEVAWRQRPPRVSIRGEESVIETLKRMGMKRLLREKWEINKDAILNEPETVRGIPGITIISGQEDFIVTPFEAKAEVAA
jgi:phage host-nuclease inhibitor protein Gam